MHENTCGRVTLLVNLMFRRLDKFDGPIFGGEYIGVTYIGVIYSGGTIKTKPVDVRLNSSKEINDKNTKSKICDIVRL